MITDREGFVEAAIEYAGKGWRPYPIQPPHGEGCSCRKGKDCDDPGKHPHHDLGGFKSATTDTEKLKTLFGQSDANIGLLCDRFWVLDIDGPQGIEDLAKLIEKNGDLPTTPKAVTGGGGRHYLFAADPRVKKSPTKVGGCSIDVKAGKTSAIVAPPSLHASGREYLVQYEALHVVAQWTGHTVETMRKFYLQVTKEHRQNAKRREKEAKAKHSELQAEADSLEKTENCRSDHNSKAKQKAKQSRSEMPRQSGSAENAEGVLSIRNSPCPDLTEGESSGRGTRTPDTRIMIPLL